MRLRQQQGVGGSLARVAQGLAPTEVGTEKPVERGWGATGEPELHGLPRNLVDEVPGPFDALIDAIVVKQTGGTQ